MYSVHTFSSMSAFFSTMCDFSRVFDSFSIRSTVDWSFSMCSSFTFSFSCNWGEGKRKRSRHHKLKEREGGREREREREKERERERERERLTAISSCVLPSSATSKLTILLLSFFCSAYKVGINKNTTQTRCPQWPTA